MRNVAAGSAAVLIVLGVFWARPAPIADLDSKACDLLAAWAGPGRQAGRVTIVEIDEKSLARFGRWPWPRDLVGRLTRGILERGAAVVALDMMFPQEDGANDQALADAISGKAVVVGYSLRFDSGDAGSLPCAVSSLPLALAGREESWGAAVFHATAAVCTVPVIAKAAPGSGFLNAAPDHDGAMRRVPVVIDYDNRYVPSLGLATLDLYRHVSTMQLVTDAWGARQLRLDGHAIPLEGRSTLRLRFRGARRTFPYVLGRRRSGWSRPARTVGRQDCGCRRIGAGLAEPGGDARRCADFGRRDTSHGDR